MDELTYKGIQLIFDKYEPPSLIFVGRSQYIIHKTIQKYYNRDRRRIKREIRKALSRKMIEPPQ